MNKIKIIISIVFGLLIASCNKDQSIESFEYQTYLYDFNDDDFSGLNGTASATIIDGELHLSSVQGFRYHTIAYDSSPHFIEGDIEIDIYPQNGRYNFETKGATAGTGILEWGILAQFKHDSLFVRQFIDGMTTLVFTNFIYEQNIWHHLRFKFNNEEGEQGRFDFWITPIFEEITEIYLGDYDYGARYGRLVGVNQFSLGVGDPNGSVTMEGIFDNIEFSVK